MSMHALTATAFWCRRALCRHDGTDIPFTSVMHIAYQFSSHFQSAITCSNLTVGTLEQGVKYIQSSQ